MLFLLLPIAAFIYHGDVQRTNDETSSWPQNNIVLFVFPKALS